MPRSLLVLSGKLNYRIIISIVFLLIANHVSAEEKQRFDIWEYKVNGNSLLEPATIESSLAPYLGVDKTLDIVEQARDNLQKIYKTNGYPIVVVSIPPQNVIGGLVTLEVTEGIIHRLKISGNKYFSRRDLRKELPSLKAGGPLNMEQVRNEIDIANQINTYRSIVPVIRPGRKKGTMEVELKVKDRLPLHAYMEANNRYTANTSKSRVNLSVGYDHLWQKHHSINLSYQISPEETDEVAVANISYATPIGATSKLVFFAVDSDSKVATITGQGDDLTVLGNGNIFGLRSILPFPSVDNYAHSLQAGLDYKDFGESQEISNQKEEDVSRLNIPITYGAWSLKYNGVVRHLGLTQFSISTNFGMPGFNDAQEFNDKRFGAKSNYFYFNGSFNQSWPIGESFDLLYSLRGQYTEEPLISNEQFSAGGIDTVRGYIESSALGDNALLANVEFQYKPFAGIKGSSIQRLDFSLFIDAARTRTLNALADANGEVISTTDLMGAGIGLSMRAYKSIFLRLYYASPLKELQSETFEDEAQLHFSLAYDFK